MTSKLSWYILLSAITFSWTQTARSASAATVYAADYFYIWAPRTCSATDPANRSTWLRLARFPNCSGSLIFTERKGYRTYPWSTETFESDSDSGYFELLNEAQIRESSGVVWAYREFREKVTREIGTYWLPRQFGYWTGKSWTKAFDIDYADEANTCSPNLITTGPGYSTITVVGLGTWGSWLQDVRSASPDPNQRHSLDVIRRSETWGANFEFTENYYYGSWLNPSTNQREGVGLVKWEKFENGVLTRSDEKHFLVDCDRPPMCQMCP